MKRGWVVAGGVLLIALLALGWRVGNQVEERLLALDVETGRVAWSQPVGEQRIGEMEASNGRLVAWSSEPGAPGELDEWWLTAWDGATGETLWRWQADATTLPEAFRSAFADAPQSRHYVTAERVYLLVANNPGFMPGVPALLIALDAATGEALWQVEGPWFGSSGYAPPPLVEVGERLFLFTIAADERVTLQALDVADGSLAWQREGVADFPYQLVWVYTGSSPVATDGERVFVATSAGVTAFAPDSGDTLWQSTSEYSGLHQIAADATAVFLLVGLDEQEIVALDPATGTERWHAPVSDLWESQEIGLGPTALYLATRGEDSSERRLIAMSRETGQRLWEHIAADVTVFTMGRWVEPVGSGLLLYDVAGDPNAIVDLAAPDGVEQWRAPVESAEATFATDGTHLFLEGEVARWRLWLAR